MRGFTLKISDVERAFGINLKRNSKAIGVDTASTTGYAIVTTLENDKIWFDVGYFSLDLSNLKDKRTREAFRYEMVYENFKSIFGDLDANTNIVIEDVYYGKNVQTVIILARIGGITYSCARDFGMLPNNISWRTASEARKVINLKSNAKKKDIVLEVNSRLGSTIKNDNEIDAIVLALNGLINGNVSEKDD